MNDHALSDAVAAVGGREIVPAKPANLPVAAAYYVAKLGWPVFPLRPAAKTPLTSNGFKDATLDLERVRRWWTDQPDANIGIPTGLRETGGIGFDVIDADGSDGVEAWMELKHRLCPPGCSRDAFCGATGGFDIRAEAFTPGNPAVGKASGRHIFVPADPNARNGARIGDRPIDIRSNGGYVCAVPSVNILRGAYTWILAPKVETP
jgi:hypothetical protein